MMEPFSGVLQVSWHILKIQFFTNSRTLLNVKKYLNESPFSLIKNMHKIDDFIFHKIFIILTKNTLFSKLAARNGNFQSVINLIKIDRNKSSMPFL